MNPQQQRKLAYILVHERESVVCVCVYVCSGWKQEDTAV